MSYKKKSRVIYIILGIFTLFTVMSLMQNDVSAHPPQSVTLSYDLETKVLAVTVTHKRFSGSHYINKVEIKKNNASVASHSYTNQPSETFTYTYQIDAVIGDVIEVKVTCSKFGSTSEKITVD